MELDYVDGFKLITKARERYSEDKRWELYSALYPHFTNERGQRLNYAYVPFEKFNKKKPKKKSRSAREIYDEVAEMRKKHGW
jgi:hypothetical protein